MGAGTESAHSAACGCKGTAMNGGGGGDGGEGAVSGDRGLAAGGVAGGSAGDMRGDEFWRRGRFSRGVDKCGGESTDGFGGDSDRHGGAVCGAGGGSSEVESLRRRFKVEFRPGMLLRSGGCFG